MAIRKLSSSPLHSRFCSEKKKRAPQAAEASSAAPTLRAQSDEDEQLCPGYKRKRMTLNNWRRQVEKFAHQTQHIPSPFRVISFHQVECRSCGYAISVGKPGTLCLCSFSPCNSTRGSLFFLSLVRDVFESDVIVLHFFFPAIFLLHITFEKKKRRAHCAQHSIDALALSSKVRKCIA
jgi:hypothetical protein